ncbi:hypothetical protein [Phragmitibacter flavus]|nr:hypothetical protein [Phragmitibacter flavus]
MEKPPARLEGLDDDIVTLDVTKTVAQPKSWMQLVTATTGPLNVLEYRVEDELLPGDELALVIGKGKWIVGKLMAKEDIKLWDRPTMQRFAVQTTENVAGTSGSPVVNVRTGRVVGVMQAADRAVGPTYLVFETMAMRLAPGSQTRSASAP